MTRYGIGSDEGRAQRPERVGSRQKLQEEELRSRWQAFLQKTQHAEQKKVSRTLPRSCHLYLNSTAAPTKVSSQDTFVPWVEAPTKVSSHDTFVERKLEKRTSGGCQTQLDAAVPVARARAAASGGRVTVSDQT